MKLFEPKEKTVVVTYDNEEYSFTLRKITWKERNTLIDKHVKFSSSGTIQLNISEFMLDVCALSLIKAPFEITRDNLEKLPEEVGTALEAELPMFFSFRKQTI